MKTTVELPDKLVREIKVKAVLEGRKFKDMLADLLRAGLATDSSPLPLKSEPKSSGFPIIKCRHAATPEREMTPDRVANILQEQEISQHAETRRQ